MATATTAAKSRAAKATEAPAEEAPKVTTEAPAEAAPKQETESQKRNRLRNEAERVIINRYKSEFEDVATALFAENGLKFNKRMTEEQKAKAKIDELIAANPALRDQLLASLGVAAPVAQAPVENPAYQTPTQFEGEGYGEDQFAAPVSPAWDQVQAPAQQ